MGSAIFSALDWLSSSERTWSSWPWKISSARADLLTWGSERIGLRCLRLSLAVAAAPFAALLAVRRGTDPLQPAVTGAVLGMASGAFAWVLVDLWCPVAYMPHLLLGHVLPIALLAIAGALAARALAR